MPTQKPSKKVAHRPAIGTGPHSHGPKSLYGVVVMNNDDTVFSEREFARKTEALNEIERLKHQSFIHHIELHTVTGPYRELPAHSVYYHRDHHGAWHETSALPASSRERPTPTGFGGRRRSSSGGDPYWTKVRFEAPCRGCGRLIHRGAQGYYFPNGRALYCDADSCGGHQARMFEAAKADERFVGGDVDY